jgi:putative intracellular protease/amidase
MRRKHALALIAAALVAGACLSVVYARRSTPAASPAATADKWVCAPCGMECDTKVYDKPGTCPVCGAALVPASSLTAASPQKRVGILVFDGVEIIDYTGPYEVFGAAGFDVYTVAETKKPVVTAMGMTVVPKYAFADAPEPDVLVVPGGDIHVPKGSPPTLTWIAERTAKAQHTLSVCNGAFLLAGAGLVDGLTVTTTAHNIDKLRAAFPKVTVVRDKRFVDNGKIIASAGLSAGIDGALHVVDGMLGRGAAQQTALGLEYDWRPEGGFARAALADQLIPRVDMDAMGHFDVTRTEGTMLAWDLELAGTSELGAVQVEERVGKAFTEGRWKQVAAKSAAGTSTTTWSFEGPDGKPWTGTLSIASRPGVAHGIAAKVHVERAG